MSLINNLTINLICTHTCGWFIESLLIYVMRADESNSSVARRCSQKVLQAGAMSAHLHFISAGTREWSVHVMYQNEQGEVRYDAMNRWVMTALSYNDSPIVSRAVLLYLNFNLVSPVLMNSKTVQSVHLHVRVLSLKVHFDGVRMYVPTKRCRTFKSYGMLSQCHYLRNVRCFTINARRFDI